MSCREGIFSSGNKFLFFEVGPAPMAKPKPMVPAKATPFNMVARNPSSEKKLFTEFGANRFKVRNRNFSSEVDKKML